MNRIELIGLEILRAKIRGFHITGSKIAKKISKSKGLRKHQLWDLKRSVGDACRCHLVAYGLIRGIPYENIEKCSKQNILSAKHIHQIIHAHLWNWEKEQDFTLSKVEEMLTVRGPLAAQEKMA